MSRRRRDAESELLPTPSEIADKRALDGACAIRNFHGKTVEQAVEMFANAANPSMFTEDLVWMRPIGFCYYIRAAMTHALSDAAVGDSDFINGLAGTLELWHERNSEELKPHAASFSTFCLVVVARFDLYDANPQIYGNLRRKYQKLAERFTRLAEDK